MVITQPTVDDFSDTTVMRVIRKIVNYICNDLVDGINNNDIVSGQFSVQGNKLSGTLTKGDGTIIDIPAATLPSGGGGSDNPYPTGVTFSLSGTTLNFSMAMSNGTPINGNVDLSGLLNGYATQEWVNRQLGNFASAEDLSDLQEQVTGLALTSNGNQMSINGTNAPIVNSISGAVADGKLKISVNGVESGDIPLPKTENGLGVINAIGAQLNLFFSFTPTKNVSRNNVSEGIDVILSQNCNIPTSNNTPQYIAGDIPNSVINRNTDGGGNYELSKIKTVNYIANITGNLELNFNTSEIVYLFIEDGKYKMPVDVIGQQGSTSAMGRRVDTPATESEYIEFEVKSGEATPITSSVVVNVSDFALYSNLSSFTLNSVTIVLDRIIKVN